MQDVTSAKSGAYQLAQQLEGNRITCKWRVEWYKSKHDRFTVSGE